MYIKPTLEVENVTNRHGHNRHKMTEMATKMTFYEVFVTVVIGFTKNLGIKNTLKSKLWKWIKLLSQNNSSTLNHTNSLFKRVDYDLWKELSLNFIAIGNLKI